MRPALAGRALGLVGSPLGLVSRSAEAMDKLMAMGWAADVVEVVRVARDLVHGVRPRATDARDAKRRAAAARG